MFGAFDASRYFKMKEEASKKKEVRCVTTEEFVKLMVENGVAEKEATLQAKISKGLGSYTQVGNEFLQVKDKE